MTQDDPNTVEDYAPPTLTVLGPVAELTLGGIGSLLDTGMLSGGKVGMR